MTFVGPSRGLDTVTRKRAFPGDRGRNICHAHLRWANSRKTWHLTHHAVTNRPHIPPCKHLPCPPPQKKTEMPRHRLFKDASPPTAAGTTARPTGGRAAGRPASCARCRGAATRPTTRRWRPSSGGSRSSSSTGGTGPVGPSGGSRVSRGRTSPGTTRRGSSRSRRATTRSTTGGRRWASRPSPSKKSSASSIGGFPALFGATSARFGHHLRTHSPKQHPIRRPHIGAS